jgi:hypothetical protein
MALRAIKTCQDDGGASFSLREALDRYTSASENFVLVP